MEVQRLTRLVTKTICQSDYRYTHTVNELKTALVHVKLI